MRALEQGTQSESYAKSKLSMKERVCFPFERKASHVAVFIARFCKCAIGILIHFWGIFLAENW